MRSQRVGHDLVTEQQIPLSKPREYNIAFHIAEGKMDGHIDR